MSEKITISELFDCRVDYLRELFEACSYPWEILPRIKDSLLKIIAEPPEGFTLMQDGVLIGRDVKIARSVTIEGPCVIGHGSEIRPGAYIRGNVITGENCILGNSSEYKNCILLSSVQTPHYNYVGDSILGNRAHMGAGSIISNLKADGRSVVIHAEKDIDTSLRKVGGFLGDGADIGSGCVINPGTVVGRHTSVYPLTPLRGVYPENSIVKSQKTIVKRST